MNPLSKWSAEFIASDAFLLTPEWKRAASMAKRRDGYECQECRRYGRHNGSRLLVHHKKERGERPDLALDQGNLETICKACHNKMHPEKGRRHGGQRNEMGYWQE